MVLALAILLGMQVPQASVTGTIRDRTTGQPLAGAAVALDDVERRVLADDAGRYVFAAVTPGPHHISVHLDGFQSRTLHALVPPSGRLEINVSLRADPIPLAGVTGGATRLRARPGLEANEAPLLKSMAAAAVRNHPLVHEADPFVALDGGAVLLHPEAPGGVHVMGGTPDQTGYELNGVPVLAAHHAAGIFSAWNLDALSWVGLSRAPAATQALSGVIEGRTREPGPRFEGQGALSNTQARATVLGPLSGAGWGYVLGVRSGQPGEILRKADPNYLTSEMSDLVGTVEGPLLGGRVTLLTYQNESEVTAASSPGDAGIPRRHGFEWDGTSRGATWTRPVRRGQVSMSLWRATSGAEIEWVDPLRPGSVRASRQDLGVAARFSGDWARGTVHAGLRATHRRASYAHGGPSGPLLLDVASARRLVVADVHYGWPVGSVLRASAGASMTHALGRAHVGPRVELAWRPQPTAQLMAGAGRRYQFTTSLRNHESVVGLVLPVDLSVNADGVGLPVMTSDDLHLTALLQPLAGALVRVTAFARTIRGVSAIAAASDAPFAIDSVAVGRGTADGLSIEATVSRTHVAFLAAWGWQEVRVRTGDRSYTPQHGVSHRAIAGFTMFPTPTLSVRLGMTGQWGRTATAFHGPLDWEACNALDQGCEFGGTPRSDPDDPGGLTLPAYLRADLGVRKHWHVSAGPLSGVLGLYGTITNLLGRPNALTYSSDPESGAVKPIPMVPLAPLVVGLDWRF